MMIVDAGSEMAATVLSPWFKWKLKACLGKKNSAISVFFLKDETQHVASAASTRHLNDLVRQETKKKDEGVADTGSAEYVGWLCVCVGWRVWLSHQAQEQLALCRGVIIITLITLMC